MKIGLTKTIFSLLCVFAVFSGPVDGQVTPTASVTGHITAQVISVLSAVETAQLNFGRFTPGPQGGELVITTESAVSALGSVWPGGGVHNAASFYVSGDPGAAYTITLPSEPVTITHLGTSRTMTVEDWRSVPADTPGAGILAGGAQTVFVGATLKVGTLTDNPVGVYTGTYTITFDFY